MLGTGRGRILTRPFENVDPGRRRIMSAIRSRDTKPEKRVRSALHAAGYRYRTHATWLPGKPDVAFPKRRVAIFIHGCFWHAHVGCRNSAIPRTRTAYWSDKLSRNVQRDAASTEQLRGLGWQVVIIWECELPEAWMDRLTAILGPASPQDKKRLHVT